MTQIDLSPNRSNDKLSNRKQSKQSFYHSLLYNDNVETLSKDHSFVDSQLDQQAFLEELKDNDYQSLSISETISRRPSMLEIVKQHEVSCNGKCSTIANDHIETNHSSNASTFLLNDSLFDDIKNHFIYLLTSNSILNAIELLEGTSEKSIIIGLAKINLFVRITEENEIDIFDALRALDNISSKHGCAMDFNSQRYYHALVKYSDVIKSAYFQEYKNKLYSQIITWFELYLIIKHINQITMADKQKSFEVFKQQQSNYDEISKEYNRRIEAKINELKVLDDIEGELLFYQSCYNKCKNLSIPFDEFIRLSKVEFNRNQPISNKIIIDEFMNMICHNLAASQVRHGPYDITNLNEFYNNRNDVIDYNSFSRYPQINNIYGDRKPDFFTNDDLNNYDKQMKPIESGNTPFHCINTPCTNNLFRSNIPPIVNNDYADKHDYSIPKTNQIGNFEEISAEKKELYENKSSNKNLSSEELCEKTEPLNHNSLQREELLEYKNTKPKLLKSVNQFTKKDIQNLKTLNVKDEHTGKYSPGKKANNKISKEIVIENKLVKNKNSKLSAIKNFNFRLLKRENVDKKVIRKFRKYLLLRNIPNEQMTSFLKSFVNNLIFPPFCNEEVSFKSFNTAYLIWVFSHEEIIHLFDEYIDLNLEKLVQYLMWAYKIDDEEERELLGKYLKNMSQIFSKFN